MTYEEYINSPLWAVLRQLAFERDGFRCVLSNSQDNLEGHHRKYPPYGKWDEDCLENITTLCRECHAAHHNSMLIRKYKSKEREEVPHEAPKVNRDFTNVKESGVMGSAHDPQ